MTRSVAPLLRLFLPFVGGIAAGEMFFSNISFSVFVGWAVALLAVVGALLLWWLGTLPRFRSALQRGRWRMLQQCLLALCLSCLGALLLLHERQVGTMDWPKEKRVWQGVVCATPQRTALGSRLQLRLTAGAWVDQRVSLYVADSSTAFSLGEHLLFRTTLHRQQPLGNPGEPSPTRWAISQGIVGTGCAFRGDIQPLMASHKAWADTTQPSSDRSKPLQNARKPLVKSAQAQTARLSPQSLPPYTLRERLLLWRSQLVALLHAHLPQHTSTLLAAMALGERASMERAERERYTLTGASHVLALSGLHLGILYALLHLLLWPLAVRAPRWLRGGILVIELALIALFVGLAGAPISLLRASLMLIIARLLSAWRNIPPLHALLLAAFGLLWLHPLWLFDVGFQLSCAAVAGILWLHPLLPQPQWFSSVSPREAALTGQRATPFLWRGIKTGLRYFYTLFTVSLAAQCATAPLVAYHFHSFSWVTLFSSLWVIPGVTLLLAGCVVFFFLPPLRWLIALGLAHVLAVMERGLDVLAMLPSAQIALYPSVWLVLGYYGLLWLLVQTRLAANTRRRLRFAFSALLLTLLLLGGYVVERELATRPRPALWVYNASVLGIHAQLANGQSYLLTDDSLRLHRALGSTVRNDWQPRQLSVHYLPLSCLSPAADTDSATKKAQKPWPRATEGIAFAPHVLLVGRYSVAVLTDSPSWAFPRAPLPVNVLVVGKNCHRSLSHLLRYYRPRQLVLEARLSPYYQARYAAEAEALALPCHAIVEQGAWHSTW